MNHTIYVDVKSKKIYLPYISQDGYVLVSLEKGDLFVKHFSGKPLPNKERFKKVSVPQSFYRASWGLKWVRRSRSKIVRGRVSDMAKETLSRVRIKMAAASQ